MTPRRFRVDPRRVVHETIDGETILIHLKTGSYFSMGGCGPEIWSLLVSGWSDAAAAEEIARRHPESAEAIETTLSFVRELVREELLEETTDGAGQEPQYADSPDGHALEAPVLNKYSDLQYFLLLDPIHEVEDAGWPHERAAAGAG